MSTKYKFQNPDGLYFISFATVGWLDVFTRKEYKNLIVENLVYCQKNKGLEIFAWCIMTNHLHLIVRSDLGYKLPNIIRDFKKHTGHLLFKTIMQNRHESRREWMIEFFKKCGQNNSGTEHYQFWQHDNHPIEIWSDEVIDQKLEYLHNNPVMENIVDKAEEYVYSSARDYHYGKSCGRIEIKSLQG